MLKKVYEILFQAYGNQGWWPLSRGLYSRHHQGHPKNNQQKFEICVGAILTQNTSWANVEKALFNLNKNHSLPLPAINQINKNKLAELIKPSGYYNMKALKLKALAKFFSENSFEIISAEENLRRTLLSVYGIGEETADSILLYAFEKPFFVIDAYTKRIFSRVLGKNFNKYSDWQLFFMKNLESDAEMFKEYHALIVEHAKQHCRKKPLCGSCCLSKECNHALTASNNAI
ncbi:MAG: endonuclease [Nanoarchaeota archaeon]|nr:endonuclease [Nanoarchaeota archaeon]